MCTRRTPDRQHQHIVQNATMCATMCYCGGKGIHGYCRSTHGANLAPMLWLVRGVEARIGLANKDMVHTIFNLEELAAGSTCAIRPAFLSRSSPHINSQLGKGKSFPVGDPTSFRPARPAPPHPPPPSSRILSQRASAPPGMDAHAQPCIVQPIIIAWSTMLDGIEGQHTSSLENPPPLDGKWPHPLSRGRW